MNWLSVALCGLLTVSCAWPQTITASLEGIVKDPSGASIQGADARILNTGTNALVELTTNQEGRFFAPALQPGSYRITVEAPGFRKAERTGLALSVAQAARLEIALEVGPVTESVEVTAAAQLLDPTGSSVGHVITDQGISRLPLNQRNPLALILLVPASLRARPDSRSRLEQSAQRRTGRLAIQRHCNLPKRRARDSVRQYAARRWNLRRVGEAQ